MDNIFSRCRITPKTSQNTSCHSIGNITEMTNMSRRSSEGSIENQVIDTDKLSVQVCIGVKPVL